jgi:hypothetical protein
MPARRGDTAWAIGSPRTELSGYAKKVSRTAAQDRASGGTCPSLFLAGPSPIHSDPRLSEHLTGSRPLETTMLADESRAKPMSFAPI